MNKGKYLSWSDKERKIVLALFASAPRAVLLEKLPGRNWNGINRQGHMMGMKRRVKGAQPNTSEVGPCAVCGEVRSLRKSKTLEKHCHTCYSRLYAARNRALRCGDEMPRKTHLATVPPVKRGRSSGLHITYEKTDRDLSDMISAAKARAHVPMIPEIAELCQAERRILQQLNARRDYVARSLQSRETV